METVLHYLKKMLVSVPLAVISGDQLEPQLVISVDNLNSSLFTSVVL